MKLKFIIYVVIACTQAIIVLRIANHDHADIATEDITPYYVAAKLETNRRNLQFLQARLGISDLARELRLPRIRSPRRESDVIVYSIDLGI